MNYLKLIFAAFVGVLLLSTASCTKDKCTTVVTYKKYTPIYKTLDEMDAEVHVLEAREMKQTGKIFVYGDYLLINELREGVHIVDNSTPSNPVNVAFLEIAGNIDIAVKNNVLYADSYFDMLTFDMSNPSSPTLLDRIKWLYPTSKYRFDRTRNAYVVGQTEEIVTEDVPCDQASSFWGNKNDQFSVNSTFASDVGSSGPISVAGSMASMVLMGDYLYIINGRKLAIYSTGSSPVLQNTVDVGFGIETLFPNGDNLFIGSRNGMFIYDNSDPLNPIQRGQFMHFSACDPVFVKDDVAYVTLRDGTPCQGATNQLDVIDVSDLMNPKLIKTYPMFNPHGLSVDDDNLYLCDGAEGLKVFGVSDLKRIDSHKEFEYPNMDSYDVIRMPNKELLIVIAKDGLYQFDLSDGVKLISKINTK